MSAEFNEVLIHLNETVDEDMLGISSKTSVRIQASSRSAIARASST